MIELSGIRKSYGGSVVVDSLDLVFASGKTTVIIGPSGCGKSTLLRLMMGLIEPDGGSVRLNGAGIERTNVTEMRRRMGYVIQDGGLFPHLTAAENITLMARHLRRAPEDVDRRLRELTDLTRFPVAGLDRYPVELSGGQCQRVSLMRALMLDPEVLLLDEPLGALDPMVRAALQEELKEIFRELGKTVVMVTHDLAEAAHLGHEIVLMNQGRVVQRGTLQDLRQRPATQFVTDFVNAQRRLVLSRE